MKTGLKTKWGFFGVIVLVFLAGNAALAGSSWECEREVTGYVCDIVYKIDDNPSAIAVSEDCEDSDSWVYVYGIPFYHLAKKHDLDLEDLLYDADDAEGAVQITILAHECPTAKEEGQLKACEIDDIVLFPPNSKTMKVSADVKGKRGN